MSGRRETETVDAIVVGGSLRGLVTAHLLAQLGYRPVVIEKGPRLSSGSFEVGGHVFDFGLHVLDYMRSEVVTRLFEAVVAASGGAIRRTRLERGLVLKGHLVPYNPAPEQLPGTLRELLPAGELVDDLGTSTPSREQLRTVYGDYADFVLDEVLDSYRCEVRHVELGVSRDALVTNLYPWFFPQATRSSGRLSGTESRRFHVGMRRRQDQHVMYPAGGGFAGFAQAFVTALEGRAEFLVGADDLHIDVDANHVVQEVRASGRRLVSRHVFWCGNDQRLAELLGLESQVLKTDRLLLGSFVFDRSPAQPYHEVLVGDPSFYMDRLSFPSAFAHGDAPTLQIEFAFPDAVTAGPLDDADHWRALWLDELRRVGIIDGTHQVQAFDFRHFRMHFNSYGPEGKRRLPPAAERVNPGSNLTPVAVFNDNRNLNGSIPPTLETVMLALTRNP